MSFKKKVTLTIMMVVSILCLVFGAVACNGESAKDAIEKYILPQNESLVDADFTLPKTIGKDVKVTWNSSHPEIIAIEDSGDKFCQGHSSRRSYPGHAHHFCRRALQGLHGARR